MRTTTDDDERSPRRTWRWDLAMMGWLGGQACHHLGSQSRLRALAILSTPSAQTPLHHAPESTDHPTPNPTNDKAKCRAARGSWWCRRARRPCASQTSSPSRVARGTPSSTCTRATWRWVNAVCYEWIGRVRLGGGCVGIGRLTVTSFDTHTILTQTNEQTNPSTIPLHSKNWAVKAKSDESPLTAADLAANNLICASLKEKYPSIPMYVCTCVCSVFWG